MTAEHKVEIGNIEKELNRLLGEKLSQGQMRACLFNLVIYAHEERRASYLHEIAHDILERFPCRIIFIKGDPTPEKDHLDVSVTNEIVGKNQRRIICDEIQISVGSKKLNRVPFLVIPHLVPDLPIYLLWGQDPTSDNEILPYLEKHASRLIFDSECTSDLQNFSSEMRTILEATRASIMDINWAYTSGWRNIIAKVFNDPENMNHLQEATHIRIFYDKSETEYVKNHEDKAIYLQGWIAANLGWNFASMYHEENKRNISYTRSEKEVHFTLVPDEEGGLYPGTIISVDIDGKGFNYKLRRLNGLHKVTVHITTEDRCEIPFTMPLPDLTNRTVFMREIFYKSVSKHYINMLKSIGQVKWETE